MATQFHSKMILNSNICHFYIHITLTLSHPKSLIRMRAPLCITGKQRQQDGEDGRGNVLTHKQTLASTTFILLNKAHLMYKYKPFANPCHYKFIHQRHGLLPNILTSYLTAFPLKEYPNTKDNQFINAAVPLHIVCSTFISYSLTKSYFQWHK